MAITLGAAAGGLLFDSSGYESTFALSAALLVASAIVAVATGRTRRPAAPSIA